MLSFIVYGLLKKKIFNGTKAGLELNAKCHQTLIIKENDHVVKLGRLEIFESLRLGDPIIELVTFGW